MSAGDDVPAVSYGRNNRGQFARGNRGGPGNPNVRRLGELQAAVREAGTPEKVLGVLDKLQSMALEGDVAASRVWLERVLGRVSHNVVIDAPEPPPDTSAPVPSTKRLCQDMIQAYELMKEAYERGGKKMQPTEEAQMAIGIAYATLGRIEAEEAAEGADE